MRPKQYNNTYKVQTSTGAEDGNISNSFEVTRTIFICPYNKV